VKRHRSTYDTEHREAEKERGPNGFRLCRWCRQETPSKRRTFCNDPQCLHEWKIRSDVGYMRGRVWSRDQGVCALCGVNTVILAAVATQEARRVLEIPNLERPAYLTASYGPMEKSRGRIVTAWTWRHVEVHRVLVRHEGKIYDAPVHSVWQWSRGREARSCEVRALWQADHIIAVAEGGGDCGLENIRTLCTWCHGQCSGALRRRLNSYRRDLETAGYRVAAVNGITHFWAKDWVSPYR
jgi:5-methylcytosine-specific restriction protein A